MEVLVGDSVNHLSKLSAINSLSSISSSISLNSSSSVPSVFRSCGGSFLYIDLYSLQPESAWGCATQMSMGHVYIGHSHGSKLYASRESDSLVVGLLLGELLFPTVPALAIFFLSRRINIINAFAIISDCFRVSRCSCCRRS